METRRIGSLAVSAVGLGCNNFGSRLDEGQSTDVLRAALDTGITLFDTADSYGSTESERIMGAALAGHRDDVVIATKFGTPLNGNSGGARPEYVRSAADASLARLQIDCIDLFQLHRPDPTTPIAETLGALNELIDEGKVREIGCSNFSVAQLREASAAVAPGQRGFVSVQNHYSLVVRDDERDVIPECARTEMAYLPFFPLANGLLTGKYAPNTNQPLDTRLTQNPERGAQVLTERNVHIAEALRTFAESRGHTLLELTFAWLLAQQALASVIAGASKPEQVRANVGSASWTLAPEDLAAIDRLAPIQ
jgi:aryl-alcohol dehydrogenase-like predicted oxidoreductase